THRATFRSYGDRPSLYSFPTRRSSDLSPLSTQLTQAGATWQTGLRRGRGENSLCPNLVALVWLQGPKHCRFGDGSSPVQINIMRSEEHTSELQSRENLVCRLLLEKKKY